MNANIGLLFILTQIACLSTCIQEARLEMAINGNSEENWLKNNQCL